MLEEAKKVLQIEAESIKELIPLLDDNFEKAVEKIALSSGRVVVMGIGKSGIIGRKISATLSSMGIPSFSLHPVDALHGDIGALSKSDIILMLSYSGYNEDLLKVVPYLKSNNFSIILFTGNLQSPLAKVAEIVINVKVKKEACPYNIAPTASSTAMLAIGDALAICILTKKGIKKEDFIRLHPGGNLGKRLTVRVIDIMRQGEDNPVISKDKKVRDALLVMTKTRLGAVSVVDETGRLVGFFTDGDLRRGLQKEKNILEKKLVEVMTASPITVKKDILAVEVGRILQEKGFDNIPVVDEDGFPIGIVDERDILREGLRGDGD